MRFKCTSCSKLINDPGVEAGAYTYCPHCGKSIVAPKQGLPEPAPKPKPASADSGKSPRTGQRGASSVRTSNRPKGGRKPSRPQSTSGSPAASESNRGIPCPMCGTPISEQIHICPNCFFNIKTNASMIKDNKRHYRDWGGILRWVILLLILVGVLYLADRYHTKIVLEKNKFVKGVDKFGDKLASQPAERAKLPPARPAQTNQPMSSSPDAAAPEEPVVPKPAIKIRPPALGEPLKSDDIKQEISRRRGQMAGSLGLIYDAILIAAPDSLIEKKQGARAYTLDALSASEPLAREEFYDYYAMAVTRSFSANGLRFDDTLAAQQVKRIQSIPPEGINAWRRALSEKTGRRLNRPSIALQIAAIDDLFVNEEYGNPERITALINRLDSIDRAQLATFIKRFPPYAGNDAGALLTIAQTDSFFDPEEKLIVSTFEDALDFGVIESR